MASKTPGALRVSRTIRESDITDQTPNPVLIVRRIPRIKSIKKGKVYAALTL